MSNTKILARVFPTQDPTRGVCVHASLPPLWPFSCFLQGSELMASSLAFSGERVCFLKPDMRLHNGSLGRTNCSLASLSAYITQCPWEACPFCRRED